MFFILNSKLTPSALALPVSMFQIYICLLKKKVNVTTALPQCFYPPRRKATFLPKPSEMFKRSNNAHRGALLEMSFQALQKILPMGAYDEVLKHLTRVYKQKQKKSKRRDK